MHEYFEGWLASFCTKHTFSVDVSMHTEHARVCVCKCACVSVCESVFIFWILISTINVGYFKTFTQVVFYCVTLLLPVSFFEDICTFTQVWLPGNSSTTNTTWLQTIFETVTPTKVPITISREDEQIVRGWFQQIAFYVCFLYLNGNSLLCNERSLH